jgi:hypothetical protein
VQTEWGFGVDGGTTPRLHPSTFQDSVKVGINSNGGFIAYTKLQATQATILQLSTGLVDNQWTSVSSYLALNETFSDHALGPAAPFNVRYGLPNDCACGCGCLNLPSSGIDHDQDGALVRKRRLKDGVGVAHLARGRHHHHVR